ncbi:MAG: tRNA dihydrouridine(20/20a) synthase DusA, partial [Gammaproteobacteria bacterium]
DFPQLEIIINGGIQSLDEASAHLAHVDGVMLGRAAYQRPWILSEVDPVLYHSDAPLTDRVDVLKAFVPYVQAQFDAGQPVWHSLRHILGLFHGCKGGRVFRRRLSTEGIRKEATPDLLAELIDTMSQYAESSTGRLHAS